MTSRRKFLTTGLATGAATVTIAAGGVNVTSNVNVQPVYPNFFMLYGPNTNGVTSIIYIEEAQAEFVRRVLDHMVVAGAQCTSFAERGLL